ncbi:rhodanese-like domain-containing protein [candidate division KSB1 bacterium]|nr:rhodanese-like domain-containing protein [candidate division KSB1 bacterium]
MKQILYLACILAFALGLSADSSAAGDKPSKWHNISADSLNNQLTKGDDSILVINTLSPIEYRDCSIPNSINIPLEKIETTDKLPKDKATQIVFYCCSERCVISKTTADVAVSKLGYTNVFILDGGLPAWKIAGYPTTTIERVQRTNILSLKPDALKKSMDTKNNWVIVDICPPIVYKTQRLPNSINIPFADLENRYVELPMNKMIIIVDKVGHRSFIAARFLKMKGVKDVRRLFGGIEEWIEYFGEESLVTDAQTKN